MFVSKKTYETAMSVVAEQKLIIDSLKNNIESLRKDNETLMVERNKLREEYQKCMESPLESPLPDVLSEGAETVFKISPNITNISPTIRYHPEIFEKLVELGYLNDTHTDNKFAIQLALLTITHEALGQIIEAFTESVDT